MPNYSLLAITSVITRMAGCQDGMISMHIVGTEKPSKDNIIFG